MAGSTEPPSGSQVALDISKDNKLLSPDQTDALLGANRMLLWTHKAVMSKTEMPTRVKHQMNFCFQNCSFEYH